MRVVGLVVEYNPLHNGHVYHFQESLRLSGAEAAVCVMSGHFLQRGEPALVGKWARAEMALAMGADIVIELPVAYSCQAAEWFAYGAVSALDATGCVDALCFGSESGELDSLQRAASVLADETPQFRADLRERLRRGDAYPAAYAAAAQAAIRAASGLGGDAGKRVQVANDAATWGQAASGDAGLAGGGAESEGDAGRPAVSDDAGLPGDAGQADGDAELDLAQPNNSLGLHYMIALRRLKSRIEPLTIARRKAGYLQASITDESIASATALRKLLAGGAGLDSLSAYVPAGTLEVLRRESAAGRAPMDWDRFAPALAHTLSASSAEELAQRYEMREGFEHRLKQALSAGFDLRSLGAVDRLLDVLKTKRYTRTALQRQLVRILLHHSKPDITRDSLAAGVPYLRVLGFSQRGRELLARMRHTARVPIVVRTAACDHPWLAMDVRATAVYSLAHPAYDPAAARWDFTRPPLMTGSPGTWV